ncbi:unnamed protein product, partial [marine sediment metagenome]
ENGNNTKNKHPANPKKPNRGFPTITPPSPTPNIAPGSNFKGVLECFPGLSTNWHYSHFSSFTH